MPQAYVVHQMIQLSSSTLPSTSRSHLRIFIQLSLLLRAGLGH